MMNLRGASPVFPAFLLILLLENCSEHSGAILSKAREGKNSHVKPAFLIQPRPLLPTCLPQFKPTSFKTQLHSLLPKPLLSPGQRQSGPHVGTRHSVHMAITQPHALCVFVLMSVFSFGGRDCVRLGLNSQHPAQCHAPGRSSVRQCRNDTYLGPGTRDTDMDTTP